MEAIVSVIIPIYNAEKTLESCLVSCLRQTLPQLEILLIDDGSTDNSRAIAETFLAHFPEKIRMFCQQNSGPSAARNLGLREAKGKYIGFLDADDRIDRDMFLRLVQAAEANRSDLVVCGRYDVVQEPDKLTMYKRTPHTFPCSSVFETPELLCDTTQFVWDKLFLREIITANHICFDERFRYTEDVLFLCQYKCYCKRIFVLPDLLYYHYNDERNPLTKYGTSLLDVPRVLQEIYTYLQSTVSFPYPDVLFDLAAKRFLFRLKRFPYMGSKKIQLQFCNRMYRVMKQYFPDWRRRIVNYHRGGFQGGFSKLYRGSFLLMSLYILLPNGLKQNFPRYFERITQAGCRFRQAVTDRKKLLCRYTDLFLNAYYRFFLSHGTLRPDCVLIQSKGGRAPSGNMFALLRESLLREKKVILVLKREEQRYWKELCTTYRIRISSVRTVVPETCRYYRLLACAATLLNDSTFPHRFIKRREQCYLNTWHGVPLKHMGCDVPARAYAIGDVQRNFLHADYLLFPNQFMQDIMLRSYMLENLYRGTIVQEAYPRVSVLTDEARRSTLREELGFTGKRICCYLPTWRGLMTKKENTRQHKDCLRYLSRLDTMLTDDVLFYVKLHPYAERGFRPETYRHIRMFPTSYETYDFLSACDVLITDYSSIFFDFAVTGRKIILFAYDYDEYKASRGLYLDPEALPFPLVRTEEALLAEINLPKTYDDTDFIRTYCPYASDRTAKKLCDLLYDNADSCRTLQLPALSLRFYYGGFLQPGAAYFHLLYLLQKQPDGGFITGICGTELREYPERIRRLLSVSPFLSVDAQFFFTPAEAVSYRLLITKHNTPKLFTSLLQYYLRRLLLRESRRKFGLSSTAEFSEILLCCDTEDRNCRIFSLTDCTKLTTIFPERNPDYEDRNHHLSPRP